MIRLKYSSKIRELTDKIHNESGFYLEYTFELNECALTDRILEKIIALAEELKKYQEKRFELNKKSKKS